MAKRTRMAPKLEETKGAKWTQRKDSQTPRVTPAEGEAGLHGRLWHPEAGWGVPAQPRVGRGLTRDRGPPTLGRHSLAGVRFEERSGEAGPSGGGDGQRGAGPLIVMLVCCRLTGQLCNHLPGHEAEPSALHHKSHFFGE